MNIPINDPNTVVFPLLENFIEKRGYHWPEVEISLITSSTAYNKDGLPLTTFFDVYIKKPEHTRVKICITHATNNVTITNVYDTFRPRTGRAANSEE